MNFDALPAQHVVDAGEPAWAVALAVASIVVFVALVLGSARLAGPALASRSGAATWPTLATMPAAARVLVTLTFLTLLLVQAVAAGGVFYHTRVVHASAREYFDDLSVVRLIGMSHAHLFGYALLYGLIGLIASFTRGKEQTKALLVSALAWSGIFDVASWWGVKLASASFEWLSIATAVASVAASVTALVLLARSLRSPAT